MKSSILALFIVLSSHGFVHGQNYKFGKVSKEEILQEKHPIDPTANAAVLYRETHSEFLYNINSGWTLVTNYHERIKIYNKEGFDYANKGIILYKGSGEDKFVGLKGYTYTVNDNGKIEETKLRKDGVFEQDISKYNKQVKLTMPNVKEGCVIEYRYAIESPFIQHIDEFQFQETIPVDKLKMQFNSPEYFVYKTYQRGWMPFKINNDTREKTMHYQESVRDVGGFGKNAAIKYVNREVRYKENIMTVELENIPAMKEEAYAGNIENYCTALQFEMSHINFPGKPMEFLATTWEDVAKNIYRMDSFGPELDQTSYFNKDLDALLAGINLPEEKMSRIFNYVVNKMTWNKYNGYYTNEGVKTAYKKGTGNIADINLMLISMLRYAKLEANPVLVSTKTNGIPLFPTRSGFNYVIAAVQLPKGTFLLDATHKNAEIGILKSHVINGEGRMIKRDGSSAWVSLRSSVPAVKSTMISMELTPTGEITGKSQNRFTGNYAFRYRNIYKLLNKDSQEKILEKELKGPEVHQFAFENLEKIGEPVAVTYDFRTNNGIEEVGGKLYFSPMLFLSTQENPFKLDKRDYPVDFEFPFKDRYIINIAIPEGYSVESTPEDLIFSLGDDIGSYRYLISQVGKNLQLSVEININESLISAQNYDGLKKFYQMLVKKENEKVVLKKA